MDRRPRPLELHARRLTGRPAHRVPPWADEAGPGSCWSLSPIITRSMWRSPPSAPRMSTIARENPPTVAAVSLGPRFCAARSRLLTAEAPPLQEQLNSTPDSPTAPSRASYARTDHSSKSHFISWPRRSEYVAPPPIAQPQPCHRSAPSMAH